VDVNLSTRHGSITEETHDRIIEKAGKLPKYFERVTSIQVTLDVENAQTVQAEIKLTVADREDFVARGTGTNAIAATDSAMQRMERQLVKAKEKLTGHRGPGHRHMDPADLDSDESSKE
jgi:putative sigma-54 modulation protein